MTTILQVIVRDPKSEAILFAEYLEIPSRTEPKEFIRAALATAFLSHGIKRGKGAELEMKKDVLVEMYAEKQMSVDEIAAAISVSPYIVGRFLRKQGVKMRSAGPRTFNVPAEMRARVVGFTSGPGKLTKKEIEQETGLSRYQIRRILTEEGVTMHRGRPKK